ncbi:MAG TPA: UvrD-helicase domain-containing protein [Oligoflexia bacterium]|nr:UvrD-helicase domain-containing protein [Oligoflexia bacterium]HMP48242.1 UvrD-helicase domain-containing protein [Oligoflexia bacterium]
MIRHLTIVRASAGSGKTHFLSGHLLNLLLAGESPSRILANTFTRKAAGEMFSRVVTRLLSALESDISCEELAKQIEWTSEDLTLTKLTPEYIKQILTRFIKNQDLVKISTLDSFFVSLGQAFFTEFDLPNNWRIADKWETLALEEEALTLMAESLGKDSVKSLLSLVAGLEIPSQIGSFILRELRELYHEFLNSDPGHWSLREVPCRANSDEKLLLINEIKSLLSGELPDSTTHLKSYRKILEGYLEYLNENRFDSILSTGFSSRIDLDKNHTYYNKPIPPSVISLTERLVKVAKAELLNEINEKSLGLAALLSSWQSALVATSKQAGVLSFAQLENCLSRNARSISTHDVFFRIDSTISHLLLDEFQDTSPSQWNTLDQIASELISKASPSNTFLAVGDSKQAIYSWRGGTSELLEELGLRYPELANSVIQLNKTYRSWPAVVRFVNLVFSDIKTNDALEYCPEARTRWAADFITHESCKTSEKGQIQVKEICFPTANEETKTEKYNRNEIESAIFSTLWADLDKILLDDSIRSVGILTRTNAQASRIERFLFKKGILVSGAGGEPLTHSKLVQLIISLCSLSEHPGDTLAFHHLKNSPLRARILQLDGPDSFKSNYILSSKLKQRILYHGLSRSIGTYLLQFKNLLTKDEEKLINHTLSLAMGCERTGVRKFSDFNNVLTSSAIESGNESKIKLMTFHKSKGLEFDVVMLPFTDDAFAKKSGPRILKKQKSALSPPDCIIRNPIKDIRKFFPDLEKMFDDWTRSQTTEGLSLCYVALTRAVHSLYIYLSPENPGFRRVGNTGSLGSLIRGALRNSETTMLPVSISLNNESISDHKNYQILYNDGTLDSDHGNISTSDLLDNKSEEIDIIRSLQDKTSITPVIPSFAEFKNVRRSTPTSVEPIISLPTNIKAISSNTDTGSGARFGTLVHKALECLDWIDEDLFSDDNFRNYLSEKSAIKNEGIISYLENAFRHTEIRKLFMPETYLKDDSSCSLTLETELPFSLIENNSIIAGRIDRIILVTRENIPVKAHIIDYKTGSLPDNQLLTKQSRAYINFAERKFKIPKDQITASFVLLGSGKSILF